MIDLLRRWFRARKTTMAPVHIVDEGHRSEAEEERERRLKELQAREHDATNRLHILEWQEAVRSRRYAEQKEKENQ